MTSCDALVTPCNPMVGSCTYLMMRSCDPVVTCDSLVTSCDLVVTSLGALMW